MFTHYRTKGIILKKTNQGEFNQFLTVYTKDFGKLKILIKSGRKISSKLRPLTDIFCLSEIEFIQGRNYKTLTDALLINNFNDFKKNLLKLSIIFKFSDTFDKLIKGEELDEKIWVLIKDFFNTINNLPVKSKKEQLEMIYYYFLWNLLNLLGYQPNLYNCLNCQKRLILEKNYFNYQQGGVICQKCLKKVKLEDFQVSSEIIKILRIVLEKKEKTILKLKRKKDFLRELENISNQYLSEILK